MAKLPLSRLAALAACAFLSALSSIESLELKPAADVLLRYGATQELNCSVNGTEKAKIEWSVPTMDGIKRLDETEIHSKNIMLRSSLKIESFSPENVGNYKCSLVENTVTVSEESIQLKAVTEIKTEPTYVLGSRSATLSCSIVYDNYVPRVKVVWLKRNLDHDELIASRKDNHRFDVYPKNNTLVVNYPIRDDSGLYIARFKLANSSSYYDCEVVYRAGPLVLDFEKSKNLIEGDDLKLKCVVKGYPHATITWYKDGQVLNISDQDIDRTTQSELYGYPNAYLFIKRVKFSDAGDYRCEAFSPEFANETSSKTITVRVKDKLAALWPFLGIVSEVVLLCAIICIYEKRKSKQIQLDDLATQQADGVAVGNTEGLRHRNANNPKA